MRSGGKEAPTGGALRAPFPYHFGGKARAAPLVWQRFGQVVNYVEPMFGSGAVLLACPPSQRPRVETVNDANAFLSNFWRAVKADPEAVAGVADYPVIETDLHARHRWLLAQAAGLREKLDADPDYFEPRIAGWWVWGASAWIGSGWCEQERPGGIPSIGAMASEGQGRNSGGGRGIHAAGMREPSRKLPLMSGATCGRDGQPLVQHGAGIHAAGARAPSRQLPDFAGGSGTHSAVGHGLHSAAHRTALYDIFAALSERLRYVRVACGDWTRICTPAVTYRHGLTAVFLDPPYDGFEHLYGATEEHAEPLSARVRAWALEMGERPDMRICLAGYEGEHDMPASWECVAWRAKGGYGNQREDGENENRKRERLWFSPACLRPGVDTGQIDMFARANGAPVRG